MQSKIVGGGIVVLVIIIAVYFFATGTHKIASNSSTTAVTTLATTIQQRSPPELTLFNSTTKNINASLGGIVTTLASDGVNISVRISPGTYVKMNGTKLSSYNFTVATFTLSSGFPSPVNQTAAYGFAFEINNKINPSAEFVSSNGTSMPVTTTTKYPDTWTSWAWLGGSLNGTAYVGGNYAVQNAWSYNTVAGTMTNTQFFKPIMWVFTIGGSATATTASSTVASTSTVASSISTTTAHAWA